MARKPSLSTEKLSELGLEKLARLVLDEAEANAGFRRKVKAALAGKAGPAGVAKVIDRRLAGLERAKSFVDWDKASAFRNDLKSLVETILSELSDDAPDLAIDRLLRFIASHKTVFERIDDSSGRVQEVYYTAIRATGDVAQRLSQDEAAHLPSRIMASLGETSHGYLIDVANMVAPALPSDVLGAWDRDLAEAIAVRKTEEASKARQRWYYSMTAQWSELRQIIASSSGDLDTLVALETDKPDHMQRPTKIAGLLLEGGRAKEALEWIRKPLPRHRRGTELDPEHAMLEADILDALEQNAEAQTLRWRCFEASLSADVLRIILKALPDFVDMEAEDRALSYAKDKAEPEQALVFLIDWKRLDHAAELILKNRYRWDGSDWHILPKIAAMLEHDYPLAATVLYRALLEDILDRGRSKAYGHGAKYIKKLALFAPDADPVRPSGMVDHATFVANLKKTHPRKAGFWGRVSG